MATPRGNPGTTPAAAFLKKRVGPAPALALVLGSGFHPGPAGLQVTARIPYAKIPGFPVPTVPGHHGELLLGQVGDVSVAILAGRVHFYEGHSMERVTFAVRALAAWGIQDLLLTNAAGGINRRFRPGDFMALTDHINFMGVNPLRGSAEPGLPRFVDLTQTYAAETRGWLRRAARAAGVKLHQGVYLAVSGPSYETSAEIRAFANWGADAVGMSTVPEALAARQAGVRVTALSCITNAAAGLGAGNISHQEVLDMAARVRQTGGRLLAEFIHHYGKNQ